MPKMNGTGPAGLGAGTGRGLGTCGGGRVGGRIGRGGYRCRRFVSVKDEKTALEEEEKFLEEELAVVRKAKEALKKSAK